MKNIKPSTQISKFLAVKKSINSAKANLALESINEINVELSTNETRQLNLAGIIKHYPPANKEWYNSIYAYNRNAIILLPSADEAISKLIKAYFNSYSIILQGRVKKMRARRYRARKMRLSTNRILVSRAELKHANDKVIITVYVYNNEKKYFLNKIKKIATVDQAGKLLKGWTIREQLNFIASKINKYINKVPTSKYLDDFKSDNSTFKKVNKLISKDAIMNKVYSHFFTKFRKGSFFSKFPKPMFFTKNRRKTKFKYKGNRFYKNVSNMKSKYKGNRFYKNKKTMQTKIKKEIYRRRKFFNSKSLKINRLLLNRLSRKTLSLISTIQSQKKGFYSYINNNGSVLGKVVHMLKLNVYETKHIKDFVSKILRREIISVYFRQLIVFNKLKFEEQYVSSLTYEIEKVYGKKIEFNFVNLKYLYMSGSIFSNTLLTKIRNRRNKFLKVMKRSLLELHLPPANRQALYNEIYNKKMIPQNIAINNTIIEPHEKHNKNIDYLDNFLSNSISKSSSNFIDITPSEIKTYAHKLAKVIDSLKHKSVTGVRIEVAGRLTKRNTAAKSVFKLRYKGNIKNTDSSDKGLSAVMLRGNARSNLQYSSLKSKIRIGSYGLKGWVSSR